MQEFEYDEVMDVKTIETERLIIRPISIDDAYDVFEWASDPMVNKFMPYPLHDKRKRVCGCA